MTRERPVPEGRHRALLAIIFSATVVIALNATMISVALPRIVSDLGASSTAGNWMLPAYMLVNGAVLVLTGQVADSFDLRVVFLTGMAVFTVTSLLLAEASSPGAFIALRAVQGLGAAMLLSTAAAMIAVGLPPERMARSMGIYLAGFATAQVAGPAVGGLVTSVWDWRGIFLINVPIGLGSLLVGWSVLRALPDRRRGRAGRAGRARTGPAVDPLGNLLILVATSAALIAVSSAQRTGWGSPVVVGGFAVVLLAAPVFVAVERRARNPAIDVELLGDRRFAMANLAGLLLVVPRMAPTILLSLWFQGLHGDRPIVAALKVTPVAVGVALGSLAADRLATRKDEARVALEWALVAAGALGVALVVMLWGGSPWALLPFMAVVGYATGVFSTANATMIMRSAPVVRAGSLNGIRTMSQTVGLSLGTALVLTLVLQSLTDVGAASFLAGEATALGVGDRAALHQGYVLAFAALMTAAVVGAVLSRLALPHRNP